MKNNVFKKLIVTGVVAFAPVMVNAESANVSIVGNSNTYLNDTITLNVSVNNIEDVKDGIVALGGDVVYDNNYLELVSATPANKPYQFDGNVISNNDYRIAGVDFTMENGIKNDTIVYSLLFKANKLGQTTVSFANADIVNTNAENINSTVSSKLVNIMAKEEVKQEIKEEKNIVKEEVKLVNNNIVPVVKETNTVINEVKNEEKNIVVNNSNSLERIAIIDRLNPFTFNKEVKGLNIMDVKFYSIFNFKREK